MMMMMMHRSAGVLILLIHCRYSQVGVSLSIRFSIGQD